MIMNEATKQYVLAHRKDDVRALALHAPADKNVDMPTALNQIQGWQTARKKLPTWAATDGIVYPPHLNMEQCSSEMTARYKASLTESEILDGKETTGSSNCQQTLVDLTGGFGVDFSFMSRHFKHAVYVERNESLCEIAKHNFDVLGMRNVTVVNGDGVEFLHSLNYDSNNAGLDADKDDKTMVADSAHTVIYLDPARRDANGRKVVGIEDCVPDVLAIKTELQEKAARVIIKLSPMLDWHAAVKAINNDGDSAQVEVHIVSVNNECKELLLVLDNSKNSGENEGPDKDKQQENDFDKDKKQEGNKVKVVCAYDDKTFTYYYSPDQRKPIMLSPDQRKTMTLSPDQRKTMTLSPDQRKPMMLEDDPGNCQYLYVPDASIMKAGCFDELSSRFSVAMVDNDSHLFVSDREISDFPGRSFRIETVTTMNKKVLRRSMTGISRANISVRNFPISTENLRKRLKLKDGGDIYLFATTWHGEHIIFVTRKTAKSV